MNFSYISNGIDFATTIMNLNQKNREKTMKKTFLSALLMSLCLTFSSGYAADLSEILKNGEIKIAVPEAFAPFGSVGKSGEHEGYDVDVAKLIAKDLGVKLVLVPVVSKQRKLI